MKKTKRKIKFADGGLVSTKSIENLQPIERGFSIKNGGVNYQEPILDGLSSIQVKQNNVGANYSDGNNQVDVNAGKGKISINYQRKF